MGATNPILGGGGFHHVSLKTRDWTRSMEFYVSVLGCTEKIAWNLRDTGKRAVMLDAGDGNYIEVFEDPDYVPAKNGSVTHFALRTTRLDAVYDRVREFGAPITVERRDATLATTNGQGAVLLRLFFCEGPSGELIEFIENTAT